MKDVLGVARICVTCAPLWRVGSEGFRPLAFGLCVYSVYMFGETHTKVHNVHNQQGGIYFEGFILLASICGL